MAENGHVPGVPPRLLELAAQVAEQQARFREDDARALARAARDRERGLTL